MHTIGQLLSDSISRFFPKNIRITDIIEILIIAVAIYYIIRWVKTTKAWTLLRGFMILAVIWIVAVMFDFHAIMYIFVNAIGVGITALIIIFQPEFRNALEQLGEKNVFFGNFGKMDTDRNKTGLSEQDIESIVMAVDEMAKHKTGALIVIEQEINISDRIKSGIILDSLISSQLICNIFEHNTPLHDGAVVIRGNRIAAATCYLPLSESMKISKELGTRHRAAIGISEVSDSVTIIVSEETGVVSIARNKDIIRNVDKDYLRVKLIECNKVNNKGPEKKKFKWLRGRGKNEDKTVNN